MATAALTVSISTSSNMGEKRTAERAQLKYLLELIAQQIGDGKTTANASLTDQSGANVGSYTYTPGASS
jgi:hypothetical protein